MATLKLPGHQRGRSSSTTTAIQRPCLTIPASTMSLTAAGKPTTTTLASTRRSSCDSFESGSTPRSTIDDPKERDRIPRRQGRWSRWGSNWGSGGSGSGSGSGWLASVRSFYSSSDNNNVLYAENESSTTLSTYNTPSTISSSHSPVSPVHQHAVDWSAPLSAEDSRSSYAPLLFVILLFPISTALVIGSLWTLPISLPTAEDDSTHSIFPRTISDVKALAWALKGYSESGSGELAHVLAVLGVTALWKHAWSIPGSVLLNILTGTLLPPLWATLLQTSLTALGSLLSTILAAPLTPIITRFFPSAISLTRSALEGSSSSSSASSSPTPLFPRSSTPPPPYTYAEKIQAQNQAATASSIWARLSVLRLIGVVPWSGINIACGVCGVALWQCFVGAFVGTLPWTAVTCQIGDILQTFATSPVSPNSPAASQQTISSVLTSPQILSKLVFLTLISLAPILARQKLSAWLNGGTEQVQDMIEQSNLTNGLANGLTNGCTGDDDDLAWRDRSRRGHKKRFSVEWWRRSLSLSRNKEGDQFMELMRPDERA